MLRGNAAAAGGRVLMGSERSRNGGLKGKQLHGQVGESRLGHAEMLRETGFRRVRHPFGEQHSGVFRKIAIVENKKELGAVGIESLNGMRDARWEIPKVTFFHVSDEAFSIIINCRDAGAA